MGFRINRHDNVYSLFSIDRLHIVKIAHMTQLRCRAAQKGNIVAKKGEGGWVDCGCIRVPQGE